MSQDTGMQCSHLGNFGLPDETTARNTVFVSGEGDRLENGGETDVECRVEETGAGQYNVRYELSSAEVGNLLITGTASKPTPEDGAATLNLNLQTTQFALEQQGDACTGVVEFAGEGAIWIHDITCDNLIEPSSPGRVCTGSAGFIAENCEH